MDLVALKAELDAGHPDTGAYSGDAATAAGEINAVNRTRNKTTLTGDEMFAATDATEFSGLTDVKQQMWVSFTRTDIDPFGTANVAFVNWIFGGGSTTIWSLAGLRTEDVSRAQELGLGNVKHANIVEARK